MNGHVRSCTCVFGFARREQNRQDGTVDDDLLQGVHVKADGTVLLGGHTEGDWNGLNAGGRDFALVELNRSGDEMWRWQVTNTRRICRFTRFS